MLTSNFIAQLRRKYNDVAEAAQVIREADGSSTLFNVGRNRIPIVENSYTAYFNTSAKVESVDYSLDKDSGDLQTMAAQGAGVKVKLNFKHAEFRDQHWIEAINYGIDSLNGRGFFRQIVRSPSGLVLSAGVMRYNGPANCVDLYEILQPGYPPRTGYATGPYLSGSLVRLQGNWSYQEDANKVTLGFRPYSTMSATISYLRNLQKYTAVSATIDVRDQWLSLVELKAGAYFFRHMASKIAMQGNATVKEGHFSFTSLRNQAVDLEAQFMEEARRVKPTRPAKDIQNALNGPGVT